MLKHFKAYQLSIEFYRECEKLKLPRHLRDQLSRASSSVTLNLAEGWGKRTLADKRKFYQIALGSMYESMAILELAGATHFEKQANFLQFCIYKLTKGLT